MTIATQAAARTLEIRPCRAGDEAAIAALFRSVLCREVSTAHRRWKLKSCSQGIENSWMALDEATAVFHYAGIESRFRIGGQPARVMVSVDAMTEPRYRRRGLLTRVATDIYSSWRRAGVAFTLGLPNQQWGSRTAALGWRELFPLQWLVRPLRPEALLARGCGIPALGRARFLGRIWNRILERRTPLHPRIQLEPVTRADARFDALWQRCGDDALLGCVRDRRWVQWRFLDCPSQDYRVVLASRAGKPLGYVAYKIDRNSRRAQMAEIFTHASDGPAYDTLLGSVIRGLIRADVDTLAILAVPGTAQYARLRRAGFVARHSFAVQVIPMDLKIPVAALVNPLHWSLSGADFDVV